MKTDNAVQIVRRDAYCPPAFTISQVSLDLHLRPEGTEVHAELEIQRVDASAQDLHLDGEGLELLSLAVDGQDLEATNYVQDGPGLVVYGVPDHFVLKSRVRIDPEANTALSGLYYADGIFLTQCEAEGFRRITYYLDRPDVMARFAVTLHAPRDRCPILLSNGNCVASGEEADGWHWARWEDPFPKPAYLFAAVAGQFHVVKDSFRTASGRNVSLEIYVAERDREACGQAMASLQHAMAWDERVYGREYDLERYLIVATDSFNMGAMENKGLNVFNSKYVLASPETATDTDYLGVESVIAHEYFHNWTGNRVTLRDWFQLSLKEGLTVFRDQEFSADMNSRGVQRIGDVRRLRSAQFAEDASPLAHPVRPDSYKEINNFYTATVYEKGAEILRMIHTLLGVEGFRAGTDVYFARHDGQAVTIEALLDALETGSGQNLQDFLGWYAQAGTPRVRAQMRWEEREQSWVLTFSQETPATPGQSQKQPVPIPVRTAVYAADGAPLRFADGDQEKILLLRAGEQEWRFSGLPQDAVFSLLRGFSAPVILEREDAKEVQPFLARHDEDPFSRWENFQGIAVDALLTRLSHPESAVLPEDLAQAVASAFSLIPTDPAFGAELLTLPSEDYLGQQLAVVEVDKIYTVRQDLRRALGSQFVHQWQSLYEESAAPYTRDGIAMGRRRVRHLALSYLLASPARGTAIGWAERLYEQADNMTDRLGAFQLLVTDPHYDPEALLQDFYARWRGHPLILDRWFSMPLWRVAEDTLERAKGLLQHPDFHWKVPNRVRAVLGAFASNPSVFHRADGASYRFYGEQLLHLDRINPQTAARLATPLSRWPRYGAARQMAMRQVLEELAAASPGLSRDLGEVVERSLHLA